MVAGVASKLRFNVDRSLKLPAFPLVVVPEMGLGALLLCMSLITEATRAYTMPWIEQVRQPPSLFAQFSSTLLTCIPAWQGLHAEEARAFPAAFLPFVPWAQVKRFCGIACHTCCCTAVASRSPETIVVSY